MRISVLDIGTNTILMLTAELSDSGRLQVISDEQAITRLGKGLDKSGAIGWDAFSRCEKQLETYIKQSRELGADLLLATGTSALRDAANQDDFVDYMSEKLNLEIEILSGDDEAIWTYGGAISGLEDRNTAFAVLDIGGGSTELTVGTGFSVSARKSLNIGCVRLTEKYLHHFPPTSGELDALLRHLKKELAEFPDFDSALTRFVGVAGTVTTLASIELGLDSRDLHKIAGFQLKIETVQKRFEQFRELSQQEMIEVMHVDPGRADIILVGVAIVKSLMEQRGIDTLTVSERGLRYGIAYREWERRFERSTMS